MLSVEALAGPVPIHEHAFATLHVTVIRGPRDGEHQRLFRRQCSCGEFNPEAEWSTTGQPIRERKRR